MKQERFLEKLVCMCTNLNIECKNSKMSQLKIRAANYFPVFFSKFSNFDTIKVLWIKYTVK